MSHIKSFDHVGITVEDLDRAEAFFVGLGLVGLVAVVGIKKEDFPSGGMEKVVGAISVLVVAAAISAAIITSARKRP